MEKDKEIKEFNENVVIIETDRKRVLLKISYIMERYGLGLNDLYFDEDLKAICDKEGNIYWD